MHTAVILSEEKDLLLLANIPSGRKKSSGAISCAGSARDTAFLVRGKRARYRFSRAREARAIPFAATVAARGPPYRRYV